VIKSQLISTAFFTDKNDNWSPSESPFLINNKKYKVITMNQIHSDIIKVVSPMRKKYKCDGLYTTKKEYILCVKTADCVPILIHSEIGVGAIHAGWRGLSQNILGNFFENEKYYSDNLKVSIGPHARKCCYEVGKEFERIFPNHILTNHKGRYLDMSSYVSDYLEKLNIEFEDVNVCTICNDRYFSYRQDKTDDRQYSFLCI